MSTPTDQTARQLEDLRDGLVQLRFSGKDGALHSLNAAEMAEVLQSVVELTSQLGKAGAMDVLMRALRMTASSPAWCWIGRSGTKHEEAHLPRLMPGRGRFDVPCRGRVEIGDPEAR